MRFAHVVSAAVFVALLTLATTTFAQVDQVTNLTATPMPGTGHNYLGMLNETVNPASGQVSLRIATPTPSGRRIRLPFSISYDSGIYRGGDGGMAGPIGGPFTRGGWSYSLPMITYGTVTKVKLPGTNFQQTCVYNVNFTFYDPQGTRHPLLPDGMISTGGPDGGCPAPGPGTVGIAGNLSVDNLGQPVAFATPDGTVYHWAAPFNFVTLPDFIEDTNGNKLTIATSAPQGPLGSLTINDTLGRAALSLTGIGNTGDTVSIAGLSNPYRFTWTTTPANFNTTWTNIRRDLQFGCRGPVTQIAVSVPGVQILSLPNGQQYNFTYDPTYGLLTQIKYPSGGWIKYQWSLNTQSEAVWTRAGDGKPPTSATFCEYVYDAPALLHRFVSFDGTTVALQQDFSYSTPNIIPPGSGAPYYKKTVVTTHDFLAGQTYNTVYTYTSFSLGGGNPSNVIPLEQSVSEYQDTNATSPLRTTNKTWFNQYELKNESITLDDGKISQTAYTYSVAGQITEKDEFDYGATSPTRETTINYQAFPNTPLLAGLASISDRPCQRTVYDNTSGTPIRVAETDYFYDNGATTTPCGTPGTPSVTGVSNATNHDETNYGPSSTASRGNVTQKTLSLSTGGSPAIAYTYDETGQVTSKTDPCGNGTCSDMTGTNHTTTYSYADSYTVLSGGQNVTCTSGCPGSGTSNAYVTQITDPLGHTSSFSYDFNNGQLTKSTDANTQATTYVYNDALSRPTKINDPDGGQTTITYSDVAPSPSLTTTKLIDNTISPNVVVASTTTTDGMGHVVKSQVTTDPDGTDSVDTAYDGSGRMRTRSNPHRSSPSTTDGTTTYTYDALNRTTNVAEPDGSNVLTGYSGNQTTVTDEAGNQRNTQTDAFGRLTAVREAPNTTGYDYETDYQYDVLGNLLCAVQKGTDTTAFTNCASASANWRPRSFVYDSLSRLTSATNPESGTITYSYDANGNLSSKIAPKPGTTNTATVTTNYSYDVGDRLTQKSYVNLSTSKAVYAYDGATLSGCSVLVPSITSPTNLVGRRSAMCSGNSSSSFSYDPMGRILFDARTNRGSSAKKYTVGYTYFKDGSLNTLAYPSGDVVTYSVGGAERTTQLSDAANNYVGYSGNFATYAPTGSLAGMTNGHTGTFAGIVTSNIYNDRLQPILLSASVSSSPIFRLCYDFHLHIVVNSSPCSFNSYTTGDNGNVFQILNNADSTRSAAFAYDSLNRISQANTATTTGAHCWGETYTIDPWGNLTNRAGVSGMSGCATEPLNAAPASVKNQLNSISYDIAGNVLNDGSGNQPTYDAENRIATDAGVTYSYDGDGARVVKSPGTMYWPGPGEETLSETDLTGIINEEYVYFNGERVARVDRPSGTVHYYFSNHLGSASVITDASGNIQQQTDYYPYGGIAFNSGSDTNHYKFTGKERDSESGLDNFEARYFTSSLGRFMTPDWAARPITVPYAVFGDPQSLNLYTYVENGPLNRVDADGHGDDGDSKHTEIANDTRSANCGFNNTATICVPGSTGYSLVAANNLADVEARNSDPTAPPPPPTPDPTAPPPPPTPDPAGVRTDSALNPSNSNSSTTNTPADQTQAPMESRGQQGSRGRGQTAKPDKPAKGTRPAPGKPGRLEEWDKHKGNWVLKPPGWSPDTAKKVGIGALIVGGAVVTGHAIAGCFASGACELGLAAAF